MGEAKPFSQEQDQIIIEMWADGCKAEVIGDRLGRSRHSILGRKSRLGLPGRDRARKKALTPEDQIKFTELRKAGWAKRCLQNTRCGSHRRSAALWWG